MILPKPTIRRITHKHTNMYLIGDERVFLFDCGWQDSFPVIKSALRDYGMGFERVAGVFVSHFHPDHAGCVELLRRHGATPLVLERQIPQVAWLNEFFRQFRNDPQGDYVPFDASTITPITLKQVREALTACGMDGEVLYTPGHSDDSISLIIGDAAFTGDLQPYETADSNPVAAASWRAIMNHSVKRVYPAHGVELEY